MAAGKADFRVDNDGSIALLLPRTDEARAWADENIDASLGFFGPSIVVEPRYLEPIIAGAIEAGFIVEVA